MKILINTASTFKGGGVQVAHSFIEECKNFSEHEYHVIQAEMVSKLVNQDEYPGNFTFYTIGFRPATRVLSIYPQDKFFKDIEKKVDPDVVFTTSGPAYWKPNAPHLVGYNLPHYIYRDSPFFSRIPFYKKLKWQLKGRVLKYFLKREADAYVVQTDDINRRLGQWLQRESIYTVSNTYSHFYENPAYAEHKLPERKNGEFRFLTLSAWYHHKNLEIIPKVIEVLPATMKNKVRFVLTLPEEIFRSKFSTELREQIINVGPVPPCEGPALYQECDALFLPTLLECFSASYAEAMKMEKPIVTSDLSFAHTVCGEAAFYADPTDQYEIADRITELVQNPKLRERLVSNGIKQQGLFATGRRRAEEFLRICNELCHVRKN